MKRALIVVVAVVVVGVCASPPVIGTMARSMMDGLLANFDVEGNGPDDALQVRVENWQAGWFTSTGDLRLQGRWLAQLPEALAPAGATTEDYRFELTLPGTVTLSHGPVLALLPDTGPRFGWDAAFGSLVRLVVTMGFFDGTTIAATLPSFAIDSQSTGRLAFHGIRTSVHFPKQSAAPSGWLTEVAVDAGGIEVAAGPTGGQFKLGQTRMEMAADVVDGTIVRTGRFSTEGLRVADRQLDDIELAFTLRHSADAAARLLEALVAAQGEAEMQDAISSFLKSPLSFSIDRLALRREGFASSASLEVEYRGDLLGEDFVFDANADATLLPLLSGRIAATVHKDLIALFGGDVEGFGHDLGTAGLLAEAGDSYTFEATLDDGDLAVGGESFDLSELLGSAETAAADPPADALTNDDIIELTRAGFSEAIILTKIETTPAHFDTSPDALTKLARMDVSERVVLALVRKARDG